MRFVLHYVITDGCTYSCDETVPIKYESKEKFKSDFELAATEAKLLGKYQFNFLNIDWETDDHIGEDWKDIPEIYTVDEWFKQFQPKPEKS